LNSCENGKRANIITTTTPLWVYVYTKNEFERRAKIEYRNKQVGWITKIEL